MEDYVTISRDDLFKIEDQDGEGIVQVDGKGEYSIPDMPIDEISIPKSLLYPKVRMSVAEKKEFDELKSDWQVLICAFDAINEIDYPRWFSRLNDYPDDNDEHQLDFARAWADPSLIEVISDRKWKVKVPRSDESYYFKDKIDGKAYLTTVSIEPKNTNGALFTDEELKQFGLDDNFFGKVEVSE